MAGIDWPGLMRWSLKFTDGTSESKRMSDEDAEFLENAIRDALSREVNHMEMAQQSAEKLTEDDDNAKIAALGVLQQCVDQAPEVHRNLHKLGAIEPVLHCLECKNDTIVEKALDVLHDVLPHNPSLQEAVKELGGLRLLMQLADDADPHNCNAKALGVCGQLLRHNADMEKEFIRRDGLSILRRQLESATAPPKAKNKAVNILNHLVVEDRIPMSQVKSFKLIEMSIKCLEMNVMSDGLLDIGFSEQLAKFVLNLAKLMQRCRIKDVAPLSNAVRKRIDYVKTVDEDMSVETDVLNETQLLLSKMARTHPLGLRKRN